MRFFSDALLPLMLTIAVRMFAGICVNLIVRCGAQFAWGSWNRSELSPCASDRVARAHAALRCLDPQWRGHYATKPISLVEICPQRTGTTLGRVS